ncbi:hypothetical protein ACWKWU_08675 [Chitinophaga lutea]
MSKKVVMVTTILFIGFFASLYFFWPQKPENPEERLASGQYVQYVTHVDIPKIRLDTGVVSLWDYAALSGRPVYMVQLDGKDRQEVVMGNRIYAMGNDGVYQEVFRYDEGLGVDGEKVLLYYGNLTTHYYGGERLQVALPFDGPVAQIALRYVSGGMIRCTTDQEWNLKLLRNLQALQQYGIGEAGVRREMVQHFIAFHYNNDNPALTRRIFDRFYTAVDREVVWQDMESIISQLDKKITSALAERH